MRTRWPGTRTAWPWSHLLALGGVRPGELPGEAEHQRVPCPKRAQARHAEYGGGHRSLHQQQPGAVADQAKYRGCDDPGQHQGTDHMQYAVAGLAERHPRLALDHGLAVHRASLQWAKHTIAALSADPRP